jgi:PKD repeat protein
MYVRDDTPDDEARYRARFYFDPNSIDMAQGDHYYIFAAFSDGDYACAVRMRMYGGEYQVHARVRDDDFTLVQMPWYTISDRPHFIELDWQAASAPDADDGYLSLWVDGELKQTLSDLDTDTTLIDEARLGPWRGALAGTQGSNYFDAFKSQKQSYIGPAGVYANFHGAPTQGLAPLTVTFTNTSQSLSEITSYLWDFGDTATSTDPNPTHIYTANGVYTVTLTASGGGDQDTVTKTHYINVTESIFADGFESGYLSAWSGAVTDGGDLGVTGGAALVGESGMQAYINDYRPMYVRDDTPDDEARYRARFYFDPNSIDMAHGDNYYIFVAYSDGVYAFTVRMRMVSGDYQVHTWLRDDDYTLVQTPWYSISDAPHFIELDWQAASAPDADDGHLSLWIDGELKQTVSDLDTDTKLIDEVWLGPWAGIDASTQGSNYFDAFESQKQSYIGPAGVYADFYGAPTQGLAPLTVSFTDTSQSASEITSYLWDFGDMGTSTDPNPTHIYAAEGVYTVTLTASGGTRTPLPRPTISPSPSPSLPTASSRGICGPGRGRSPTAGT